MKNTLKEAKFRILIYKAKDGYVGICYETGWVDVFDTMEETKKHLMDSLVILMKSIKKGDLSEKAMNQSPTLKYKFLFFVLPLFFAFFDISFFTEPVRPILAGANT